MMLFISSMCELVKFDRVQTRSFREVCANEKYYENSIFKFENQFDAQDDSDDGINISGILLTPIDKFTCNYHVRVPQQLKDRTLAFLNRVRWLTGYQRNITWDETKDDETCQCSFVRWAAVRPIDYSSHNGFCTNQFPKWKEGCLNSNTIKYPHRKMSNGIYNLYNEGFIGVDQRNLMLSQHLTKTSMCTVSLGKRIWNFGLTPTDYFTMNLQFNDNIEEELPFIASPPPGFIPYYMMPSIISLLAKDINDPKDSEFKVYYNGNMISGFNETLFSPREKYHGYNFDLKEALMRNYSHLVRDFVPGARDLFFPPGSVFGFEATNNGKTYTWNTTLVDCELDVGKYPDPIYDPKSKQASNADNSTKTMNDTDGTSSQKLGLSQKQKVGIGVGVTLGVAAVAGAVVGGLVFAGVIGGGSAVAGSGAATGV